MTDDAENEFLRLPGLFRLWDLQQVLQGGDDYHIAYVGMTEAHEPLFAVYRRIGPDATDAGLAQ